MCVCLQTGDGALEAPVALFWAYIYCRTLVLVWGASRAPSPACKQAHTEGAHGKWGDVDFLMRNSYFHLHLFTGWGWGSRSPRCLILGLYILLDSGIGLGGFESPHPPPVSRRTRKGLVESGGMLFSDSLIEKFILPSQMKHCKRIRPLKNDLKLNAIPISHALIDSFSL